MHSLHRRDFFGSSLSGLAALAFSGPLLDGDARAAQLAPSPAARKLDPKSLFLTWERDPTTTMTIQWVGPEAPEGALVRCVPQNGDLWQIARTVGKVALDQFFVRRRPSEVWHAATINSRPFPDTDLKVHRSELVGLAPGTDYYFQIGANSPIYQFRTMPAKATNTIQFVSGGDCGTGSHAIGTNKLAAKQDPYFALIGGDLAYDNGRSPKTFLTFLENYRRHMVDSKGRLIPMLSCIGNHEVDGGYSKNRAKSPHYLSVFDGLFHETTYGVLDIGDYMSLVLLDSGHLAPIGGAQTDWLAQTLAERQDRRHLVVANHVPAYPSYRAPEGNGKSLGAGEANRIHWCPLFEKYKVDVVLEHHDHTFKRTHPLTDGRPDKNGVLYLGDGSWGKLRVPKKPEARPYLAAVSEAYHLSVHRLEGEQVFHVALEENGRVADVCMTQGKRPSKRASPPS